MYYKGERSDRDGGGDDYFGGLEEGDQREGREGGIYQKQGTC